MPEFTREKIESLKRISRVLQNGFSGEKPSRFLEKCFVCGTAAMFDSLDGITCGRSMCCDELVDEICKIEEAAGKLEAVSRDLASEQERNNELNSVLRELYEAMEIIFPTDENTSQIIRKLLEKARKTLY